MKNSKIKRIGNAALLLAIMAALALIILKAWVYVHFIIKYW